MQNRILNTINNSGGKINHTLYGSVIYGVTTIVCSLILFKISKFGLAWAGNIAYFYQFIYLFYANIKEKTLKISKSETLTLISSIIFSFLISFILNKVYKVFDSIVFSSSFSFFGINIIKSLFYVLPFFTIYFLYLLIFYKYSKLLFVKDT